MGLEKFQWLKKLKPIMQVTQYLCLYMYFPPLFYKLFKTNFAITVRLNDILGNA